MQPFIQSFIIQANTRVLLMQQLKLKNIIKQLRSVHNWVYSSGCAHSWVIERSHTCGIFRLSHWTQSYMWDIQFHIASSWKYSLFKILFLFSRWNTYCRSSGKCSSDFLELKWSLLNMLFLSNTDSNFASLRLTFNLLRFNSLPLYFQTRDLSF